MVAVSDIVMASDEDLAALYPALDTVAAARHLLTLGPSAVVVTRGGAGATWVGADRTVDVASQPVEVADTIGAGDSFQAALLFALRELDRIKAPALAAASGGELRRALTFAAACAAVTCSRSGANPPRSSEVESALAALLSGS